MRVNIGIIGTGGMGNEHARQFAKVRGCKVVAACDVDVERVEAYAKEHGIARCYTSAEALLQDPDVHAVSIVTPDASHASLSILACRYGKHVLCEKPLATNHKDAMRMVAAARKAKVVNMVNFSYRNSSAIQKAQKMVAEGKLGAIYHVHAHYLQSWLAQDMWSDWHTEPAWLWRLSTQHGSKGVLGDIGVHILDFATYPVGKLKHLHCKLKTFKKAPRNRIGEYLLDANDSALITAEFAGGAMGTIHTTRWAAPHVNSLKLNLYGDEGTIEIDLDQSYETLRYCPVKNRKLGEWKTIKCGKEPGMYKRFVAAVRAGEGGEPDFVRGAQVQKWLDACVTSDAEDKTVKV